MDIPKTNSEMRDTYFEKKKSEFEDSCFEKKIADACFCLGEWHQVIGKNEEKASEIYEENCLTKNHSKSCFNLSKIYLQGKAKGQFNNLPPKLAALELSKKACLESGKQHAESCFMYSSLLIQNVNKNNNDIQEGLKLLTELCESPYNDARACVKIGAAYLRGDTIYEGVPQDLNKAHSFVKRACDELGHPNGCQILAVMYKNGHGVEKDEKKSIHYQDMTKALLRKTGEKLGTVHVSPPS